jgi:hypothetical protein
MVQLVGKSSGTPVSGTFPDGTTIMSQQFVATASGTATTGVFYYVNTFATSRDFVIVVYDSGENLLATSNQGTTGTSDGFKTATFSSPPTITSGQTYRLGMFPSATLDFAGTGTGEQALYQNGLTFPTAQSTFVSNGDDTPGLLFIYLDGTASGFIDFCSGSDDMSDCGDCGDM